MQRIGRLADLGVLNRQIKHCRVHVAAAEKRLENARDCGDKKLARDTLLTYNASLILLLRVRGFLRKSVLDELGTRTDRQ
jgi:hypothetical protein